MSVLEVRDRRHRGLLRAHLLTGVCLRNRCLSYVYAPADSCLPQGRVFVLRVGTGVFLTRTGRAVGQRCHRGLLQAQLLTGLLLELTTRVQWTGVCRVYKRQSPMQVRQTAVRQTDPRGT